MGTRTDLQRFRFYADGTESGAAALAAQNTNVEVDVTSGNVQLALRAGLQEVGAALNSNGFQVDFSLNGAAYVALTTSTSPVKAFDSASLTNDAATTNRLTGGTGSFDAGKVTEDGFTANTTLSANNRTEVLATLELVASALRDGDVLDFHVYQIAGDDDVFTVTPRIVVVKDPNSRFFAMFNQGFGR